QRLTQQDRGHSLFGIVRHHSNRRDLGGRSGCAAHRKVEKTFVGTREGEKTRIVQTLANGEKDHERRQYPPKHPLSRVLVATCSESSLV
ncbi:hypothetical protein PENTCL1PPCAC_29780, partial [Pristionchus entomophagus]